MTQRDVLVSCCLEGHYKYPISSHQRKWCCFANLCKLHPSSPRKLNVCRIFPSLQIKRCGKVCTSFFVIQRPSNKHEYKVRVVTSHELPVPTFHFGLILKMGHRCLNAVSNSSLKKNLIMFSTCFKLPIVTVHTHHKLTTAMPRAILHSTVAAGVILWPPCSLELQISWNRQTDTHRHSYT